MLSNFGNYSRLSTKRRQQSQYLNMEQLEPRQMMACDIAHEASALGDYNSDELVDTADYSVWRDTLGSTTDLRADANSDGVVDMADYSHWRSRFGQSVPQPGVHGVVNEGILSVCGTAGEDVITIRQQAGQIAIDGLPETFAADRITSITINAGDGNDTVDFTSLSAISVTVEAGAGNDVVRGGGGDDHLHGGLGNDTLQGNGGNDTIDGGSGHDVIGGGAGDDILAGAANPSFDTDEVASVEMVEGLLLEDVEDDNGNHGSDDFVIVGRKWGEQVFEAGAIVTYSFMRDGVINNSGIGSNWTNQDIDSFMPEGAKNEIRRAFDAWSSIADIRFVELIDGGENFNANPTVSDIRIGGHVINNTDPDSVTLAHAFFPPPNLKSAAGDLHFNTQVDWHVDSIDGDARTVDIFQVAAHEIGHAIGLGHQQPHVRALMNPFYSEAFNGPQFDDIAGAQLLYGDGPPSLPIDFAGAARQLPGDSLLTHFYDVDRDPADEVRFRYGFPTDRVIAGDFNRDGVDEVGTVRNHQNGGLQWFLDADQDPSDEFRFQFGLVGDTPFTGDFNGDGFEDVAVVRPNAFPDPVVGLPTLQWFISYGPFPQSGSSASNNFMPVDEIRTYGFEGDRPVVGDWNGDGADDVGIVSQVPIDYNGTHLTRWYLADPTGGRTIDFGYESDIPVVGDYDGDGDDDVAVVRERPGNTSQWFFDTDGDPGAEGRFEFGLAGDQYFSGNWDAGSGNGSGGGIGSSVTATPTKDATEVAFAGFTDIDQRLESRADAILIDPQRAWKTAKESLSFLPLHLAAEKKDAKNQWKDSIELTAIDDSLLSAERSVQRVARDSFFTSFGEEAVGFKLTVNLLS